MNEAGPQPAPADGNITSGAQRRLARKRAARAVQDQRMADAAHLIAEGRFAEAREMFDTAIHGETGDPRVRLRTSPNALPLVRPVFICGLHRSGTTLLIDRMKAQFDVGWLQNNRVPEGEGQFLQDVYPQEMPFGGPGKFAFAPQMRLRPVADPEAARAQAARLAACWGRHAQGGTRLVEKSPSNIVRIGYLRSLFPDARFIVWTRDPRAVSLATRKWSRRSDPGSLMLHWNTAYLAALEDLGDDCVIARYEDFCADHEAELKRIGRFCDLTDRPTPLPMRDRFEAIRNSNEEYFAGFPADALRHDGVAAWELFGYRMPHPQRGRRAGDDPAVEVHRDGPGAEAALAAGEVEPGRHPAPRQRPVPQRQGAAGTILSGNA